MGKLPGKAHGFRLQGMLILLPGLLLAAWGAVNLSRDHTAADAETRMQMHTAVELVRSRVGELMEGAPEGWSRELTVVSVREAALHSPLLYPEIPEPQAESEAQRLFAEGKYAQVYGEHREALSASGLPLAALSAEGMVRTSDTPAQKLHWAELCAAEALNHHPSPVSAVVVENAVRHLAEQYIAIPASLLRWEREWQQRLALRDLLRTRAADLVLLQRIAVIDSVTGPWMIRPEGDHLRIWPVPWLQGALSRLTNQSLRNEIPGWMGFRLFTEDGYSIFPGTEDRARSAPGAVASTAGGLHLEAVIQSPASLHRARQRRLLVQGCLLAAALGVTVFAWLHARRAWMRQADLSQQKDNFLASVSHELRTPLASVRTLTENLADGTVTEEPARQHYYAVMLQEMRRLSGLVENVLDFARISQDRKEYSFVPCDAAEVVTEALRPMQALAAKRGITLTEAPEPLPQTPLADAAALQQALINLVDNALKFAPDHSTVRVRVRPAGDRWELCVEDDGPGIPQGEEQRIFERFYRAGSELRRETAGAGIGLSIVQHIARGHGGEAFASTRPEGGACVGIRLPYVPQPDISP